MARFSGSIIVTGTPIPFSGPAGGDLASLYPNPVVAKLLTRPLGATAPAIGDALTWDGSAWSPLPRPGSIITFGATSPSTAAPGVTRYLNPYTMSASSSATALQFVAPRAGTISSMFVLHGGVSAATAPIRYEIRVGGVLTGVFVLLPANVAVGSDPANTFPVAAGGLIDVQTTKPAGNPAPLPTNVCVSFVFR